MRLTGLDEAMKESKISTAPTNDKIEAVAVTAMPMPMYQREDL